MTDASRSPEPSPPGTDARRPRRTLWTFLVWVVVFALDQVTKVRSERALFHGAGPDDAHLASDLGYLALGVVERAEALRAAQPPEIRDLVAGYVAGGISPFGQKRANPTVLDESALTHDTVYVSAGRRGLDVAVAPADLVSVTGATTAVISRW